MSLKNKNILVFGASGVIGSGIAKELAEEGAHVIVYFRGERGLPELKNYFKGKESQLTVYQGELTHDGLEKLKKEVLEKHHKIDGVYSSLGSYQELGPLTAVSEEQVLQALNDLAVSHWRVAKVFLPYLKDKEGSSYVVVTGGLGGAVFNPNASLVTVGAAALFGISLGLRKESEGTKVRFHEFRLGLWTGRDEEKGEKTSNFAVGKVAARLAGPHKHDQHIVHVNQPAHLDLHFK